MKLNQTKRLYACVYCCSADFKKKGYFYKKVTKTYIPRYLCLNCKKNFSTSTLAKTFRQKRPDLNTKIFKLVCSGVSFRQSALTLGCSYNTVYEKFLWLSEKARLFHLNQSFRVKELQFDEMESIEHTKLKPLSIAMAVSEDYRILGVRVGTIPAKGHLSRISIKKYGFRENQSSLITQELLLSLKGSISNKDFILKSDAKISYKQIAKNAFPNHIHESFVAKDNKEKRREMKYTNQEKRIFDPLFAINQRFAKLRDHIKRLTRRSWCTTKKIENLEKHIYLYMAQNNNYVFI